MVHSQATFNVQSSGRGLENAKMNARMQQLHNNQQATLDLLQPQSFAVLPDCDAAGEKINWNSATSTFTCVQEDDPTVSSFAKDVLPTCGGTEFLVGDGVDLSCVDATAVVTGAEIDPTVEDFAKDPLPTCGANEALKGDGTSMTCVAISGAGVESDPTVYSFAQSPLPTCGVGQVLKANGTSLSCVADTDGGFTESDPLVLSFAKNVLPTCAADEVLSGDGTALSCVDAATAAAGAADDLGNHTATESLKMAGFAIENMADPTNAQDGATKAYVDAEVAAGVASVSETDPTVETFAKNTLPNCTASQLLSGNGTALSCVDAATAAAGAADDMGDHTATQNLDMAGFNIESAGSVSGTSANFTGLDMNSNAISNVANPTNAQDAATKDYVDTLVAGGSGDSGTLDGLDSTQFLRSDVSDTTLGHLGVGGSDYDAILTITGTSDLANANDTGEGGILIQAEAGDAAGYKMRIDNNEIQVSHGGGASTLLLNAYGGDVLLGANNPASTGLRMTSGTISELADPTADHHAATKAYVDAQVAAGGADNLGNHIAGQNIQLGSYYLSGDGDDEGVFIASTGHVGIGTTSPSSTFHVRSNRAELEVGVNDGGIKMWGNNFGNNFGAVRIYADSDNGQDDVALDVLAVSDPRTGDSSGAVSLFKVMTRAAGVPNVGIGIDTPSSTLHINGDIQIGNSSAACASTTAGAMRYNGGSIELCNGTAWGVLGGGGADNLGNHTAGQNIQLGNYYLSGDGDDEGVFIASTGHVGIGTTSPSSTFHVRSNRAELEVGVNDGGIKMWGNNFGNNFGAVRIYADSDNGQDDVALDVLAVSDPRTGDSSGAVSLFKVMTRAAGVPNVGIGTASPSGTLHLETANATELYIVNNKADGPDIQYDFDAFVAAEGDYYISIDSDNNLTNNSFQIVTNVDNTPNDETPLFKVTDEGNVTFSGWMKSQGTSFNDATLNLGDNAAGPEIQIAGTIANGADIHMNSNGYLSADDNLYLSIDSNNDSTDAGVKIVANTTSSPQGSTLLFEFDENGDALILGTATATGFVNSSDRRLKDDIRTVLNPIELIRKLRGVFYKWKDSGRER